MKLKYTIFCLFLTPALFAQIAFQKFPKSLQLYPRNLATNSAELQISGTAAPSPDSLVFTLTKSDGAVEIQTLSLNDLSGNHFDVQFEIVAGLWSYDLKVERKSPGQANLLFSATNIVAGDVMVVQGQSNAQAVAYNGDANIWQNNYVRCFGTPNPAVFDDEQWYLAEGNGYFTPGAIGQWALRLGYLLQENLHIPIAIINGADPGKPIEFFQRNDALPYDSTTNYGRLLKRLTNAGVRENVRAVLYYQGESDGDRADIHKTLFEALYADWAEDLPQVEAYYVVQVREGCGNPSLQLREYQRRFEDYLPKTHAVTANGINGHDGCHYNLLGYKTLGEKIYKQVSADLYQTSSGEQANIRALSARFTNDLNTQIAVQTDAAGILTAQPGSAYDFRIHGVSATVIGIQTDGDQLLLDLDQSVNSPNARLSYSGHSGSDAWVLNGFGHGMFTFYNLSIDNYHEVPNHGIAGIMSGSGNCISMDGVNDLVYVGPVLNSSYTKEAWINWQGGSLANNIISGAANTAFWLPNGVLSAGHNNAWWQVTDNVVMTPNQWTHVAVSYDSALAELRLYKNGKLVSQAQNIPAHNDPEVLIGAYGYCCTFQGKMDEVRVWDSARSEEEIRANMCQKLLGTEPGLSAYFRFDELSGGVAPDASGGTSGQLLNFQGLGINEAWHRSGAPIGTKSVYSYGGADEIGLAGNHGDSLVLTAHQMQDFVHLYFVDEVPNVLTPADGYVLVDNTRYFGLFYANGGAQGYDLKYSYDQNPFAFVQEENLGLLKRRNNAQTFWEQAPAVQFNTNENSVSVAGTQYQEYILALNDSVAQAPLTAQLSMAQQILCAGIQVGAVQVSAQGGQAPYWYRLNGGAAQSSPFFTGLPAGNYTATIADQNGNEVTTNLVTLQSPLPLTASVQVSQNNATLEITGGTPPYSWSGNIPGSSLQNLPNGSYLLQVSDANGCPTSSNFTIDFQALALSTILSDQDPCDGTGELVIIAQGGEAPYLFSLNNGAFQAGNFFQGLYPGAYKALAKDALGTVVALPLVEINVPYLLSAEAMVTGDTVAVTPFAGTPPYQYQLNGGASTTDSIFNGLLVGEHTILVTDAAGCSTTLQVSILANGTHDTSFNWHLKVHPNPGRGLYLLTGAQTGKDVSLTIKDITGRTLQRADLHVPGGSFSHRLDLTGESAGVYFLQLTDGQRYETLRLVQLR